MQVTYWMDMIPGGVLSVLLGFVARAGAIQARLTQCA